ncbi:M60 family metallopeptidase [Verrucomicrobiota bacterium]
MDTQKENPNIKHWFIILFVVLCGFSVYGEEPTNDIDFLLKNISSVKQIGLPGALVLTDKSAFPVLLGARNENTYRVIAGAGHYGKGRYLAFGHSGYLSDSSPEIIKLLRNALPWLAQKDKGFVVGTYQSTKTHQILTKNKIKSKELIGRTWTRHLSKIDVVCLPAGKSLSESDIKNLIKFVQGGGGIVSSGTAWGWSQITKNKIPADFPGNKLFGPMGLLWSLETQGQIIPAHKADSEIIKLCNTFSALEALAEIQQKQKKPSKNIVKQISTTLLLALKCLPEDDKKILPQINSLMSGSNSAPVITDKKPLREENILERMAILMRHQTYKTLPPEKIPVDPCSQYYPGSVPENVSFVTRTFSFRPEAKSWFGTGLYAAAGTVVSVKFNKTPPNGLFMRIGSTTCSNWKHSAWKRFPEIHRRFPVTSKNLRIASPFGGLIYCEIPKNYDGGTISMTVSKAVQAPLFVLGKTTKEEWLKLRELPAPWAELQGEKIILSIPSRFIRDLDDPSALMEEWDKIVAAQDELAGYKGKHARKRPERIVPDIQICIGGLHAGYPIMGGIWKDDGWLNYVSLKRLKEENQWGFWHELGHNHQNRDWTFQGAGEVTVNLFSLYVGEVVYGRKFEECHKRLRKRKQDINQYLSKGTFADWQKEPFLALIMYIQLQEAFGWDTYKRLFAEYLDLPESKRPKTDADERDQWMIRFSKAVNKNLGPFFQAWKIPVSAKAIQSIKNMPVWMPDEMKQARQKTSR